MYRKLQTLLALFALGALLSCGGVLSDSSPVITAENMIRVRASVDETKSTFVQWQGQAL